MHVKIILFVTGCLARKIKMYILYEQTLFANTYCSRKCLVSSCMFSLDIFAFCKSSSTDYKKRNSIDINNMFSSIHLHTKLIVQ